MSPTEIAICKLGLAYSNYDIDIISSVISMHDPEHINLAVDKCNKSVPDKDGYYDEEIKSHAMFLQFIIEKIKQAQIRKDKLYCEKKIGLDKNGNVV